MVIQNIETKKEYPISKAKWDGMSEKGRALFKVLDNKDLENPDEQPIKNVVKKQEPQKPKVTKPNTGNKVEEKENKHKK